MTNRIKIKLLGSPLSSQTIYRRNGTCFYITREAKAVKQNYIQQIKNQYFGPIIADPLKVKIKLYFKDKRRRDWDNFHKLTLDSLQGLVIQDDAQILEAFVQKYYDRRNPRCEISLQKIK